MIDDNEVHDFLEHFGVKGMQWGVRKSSATRTAKKAEKSLNKEARSDYVALQRTGQRYGYGMKYRNKKAEITTKKENPDYAKAYKKAPKSIARRQVAAGVSVMAGYLFVAAILNRAGNRPRPGYGNSGPRSGGYGNSGPRSGGARPRYRPPTKSVADIINAERNTQISSLKRTHREGHLDDDQLRTFLATLNRRYDRRIAEAGGG